MSDKCEHSSAVVERGCTGFTVLRCTWECGKDLIELDMGKGWVKTFTADELRDRLARQERAIAAAKEYAQAIGDHDASYSERLKRYNAFMAALKEIEP
jgi:hypothetical protein